MKAIAIRQEPEVEIGFLELTEYVLQEERRRAEAAEIAWSSFEVFRGRVTNYLLPYFRDSAPSQISPRQISAFMAKLQAKNLKASSIRLILTSLRRVLYYGYLNGWCQSLPVMPRIRSDSTPRAGSHRENIFASGMRLGGNAPYVRRNPAVRYIIFLKIIPCSNRCPI